MSNEAWMVDTAGQYWVFGYEQDANNKVADLHDDGLPCEMVRLVPVTEVEKLKAALKDLKARLRAARRAAQADEPWMESVPVIERVTDLRNKNWRKP